jgi:hypothetical protein
VARKHDGSVVFSAWDVIPHCISAEMCEAIACLESLKVAAKFTTENLVFETNCSSLIKIFDPGATDRSAVTIIANDFNDLRPEGRITKLVHVSRKANVVAHSLAQLGHRELCCGVTQGQVPSCVMEFVVQDCKNQLPID